MTQPVAELKHETISPTGQRVEEVLRQAEMLSREEQKTILKRLLQLVGTESVSVTEDNTEVLSQEATEPAEIPSTVKSILDIAREIAEGAPEEVIAQLPSDGALEHDHYIYGTPKKYS